jgi:hypothetical protein
MDELELALDELPGEQCEVFVAHVLEGQSFKEKSGSLRGDRGDGGIYRHWRRNRAAPVELATAVALQMAADYLVAGARTAAFEPDSARRPWCSRFSSFPYAFQDAGSNGERREQMRPEER